MHPSRGGLASGLFLLFLLAGCLSPSGHEHGENPFNAPGFAWSGPRHLVEAKTQDPGNSILAVKFSVANQTAYQINGTTVATWESSKVMWILQEIIKVTNRTLISATAGSTFTLPSCTSDSPTRASLNDCEVKSSWTERDGTKKGGVLRPGTYVVHLTAFGASSVAHDLKLWFNQSVSLSWIQEGPSGIAWADPDASGANHNVSLEFNEPNWVAVGTARSGPMQNVSISHAEKAYAFESVQALWQETNSGLVIDRPGALMPAGVVHIVAGVHPQRGEANAVVVGFIPRILVQPTGLFDALGPGSFGIDEWSSSNPHAGKVEETYSLTFT